MYINMVKNINYVSVVILNYIKYDETIECVNSLLHQKEININIIIVDNGSPNESLFVLKDLYGKIINVKILSSDVNLGFAKGNNMGINYSRNCLGIEHILCTNSDTIFDDELFLRKMVDYLATDEKVAMVGPNIENVNGFYQNPIDRPVDKQYLIKEKMNLKSKARVIKRSFIYKAIKKYVLSLNVISDITRKPKDMFLHGSCFLLRPEFFKFYPYLYPLTFLYYEEDILFIIIKKVGLRQEFCSQAHVLHKEGQSAKKSWSNYSVMRDKYLLDSIDKAIECFDLDYTELIQKFK